MGLTGFAAATSKAPYLQKINQLSQQFIQLLPADSPYRDQARAENKAEEKLLGKSKLIAFIAIIGMLCFFVLYYIILQPNHIIEYLAVAIAMLGLFGMFSKLRK